MTTLIREDSVETTRDSLEATRDTLMAELDVLVEKLDRRVGDASDHRAAVAAIATALAQIAEGTYGTCLGCGEAVDLDRLAEDPATSTCIGCTAQDHRLIG